MDKFNIPLRSCPYCFIVNNWECVGQDILPWNVILYETENFVVVPTLGSLVAGWLLIISKGHYLSMGAIPESQHAELNEVIEHVSTILKQAYCSPTIFEHGASVPKSKVGCGIDHAHLHLVPLNYSIIRVSEKILPNKLPTNSVDVLQNMHQMYNSAMPYLFVMEPNAAGKFFDASSGQSQFFRRVIAKQEGYPEKFDYRNYSFEENVRATINKLKPYFEISFATPLQG